MNLLWHILADNSNQIILQTFDISEQKLSEYKKLVAELIDLPFVDKRVITLTLELDWVRKNTL